jgi:Pectinacetylesterase
MSYAARRGARRRVATACIGTLSTMLLLVACSDSGSDGPDGTGGIDGSDDAGTDAEFSDVRAEKVDAHRDAPLLPWTAVPVAGTLCRDGTPTGYAINVNPRSRKLLIFLEGGGACFNELSCRQNPESWPPNDASITRSMSRNWIMSRASQDSPFREWNLAYIPYCSGDVHTGSAMSGYLGQPQIGHLNYKKDLAELVARFRDVDQVVLAGVSAGGFGVAWNWMWTQDAFGSIPVYAIDDSGQPLGPDYLAHCQQKNYGALWGWRETLHPACTDCDVDAGNVVRPLLATSFTRSTSTRFGLLSYDEDGTIKSFFAYGTNNCSNWDAPEPPIYPTGMFPMGLNELRQAWSIYPQVAMYVVAGGHHTFLGTDIASVKTGPAISMLEWIKRLIDKSDGWANVAP